MPVVRPEFIGAQAADGIHDQVAAVTAGDPAQGLDVVKHARRCLAVGGQHGFEGSLFPQDTVDLVGIRGGPPLHVKRQGVDAEGRAQFDPPAAEFASADRQHPVSRR